MNRIQLLSKLVNLPGILSKIFHLLSRVKVLVAASYSISCQALSASHLASQTHHWLVILRTMFSRRLARSMAAACATAAAAGAPVYRENLNATMKGRQSSQTSPILSACLGARSSGPLRGLATDSARARGPQHCAWWSQKRSSAVRMAFRSTSAQWRPTHGIGPQSLQVGPGRGLRRRRDDLRILSLLAQ